MEVAEERLSLAFAIPQPVEVGVQRVGELPRTASRIQCIRRAIENRPVLQYEVIPRRFISGGAGTGEGQLLEAQRRKVVFEVASRRRAAGKCLGGARLERLRRSGPAAAATGWRWPGDRARRGAWRR